MSLSPDQLQNLTRRLELIRERASCFSELNERTLQILMGKNDSAREYLLREYLDIAADREFAGPSRDYHRAALKELFSIVMHCEEIQSETGPYELNWGLINFLLSKIEYFGRRQRESST